MFPALFNRGKTMRKYRFSFVVAENLLATVIQVLARDVRDINIIEVENSAEIKRRDFASLEKKPSAHSGNRQCAETRAGRIILAALNDGELSLSELGEALAKHGFAKTSASPTTTRLIMEGDIERVGMGRFKIKGTTS